VDNNIKVDVTAIDCEVTIWLEFSQHRF